MSYLPTPAGHEDAPLPQLVDLIAELRAYKDDPWAIHDRYGPTPGPTLHQHIWSVVHEYLTTHPPKKSGAL